ncbi:putative dehydrogenase [SAR116 cluster alpha proteobacterium HIMB100]|nr:putative dehydrogenase [SAR116 cluster alpha proteobacterium HIMB100]
MGKQTVLVTGASRGIGKAIAERCLDDGLEVVGLSTSASNDLPWRHYGVDLAGEDAKAQLAEIIDKHRPCRFVGNAGVLINGRLEDVDAADFDRLMRVNLLSLMETANLMLPVWKDERFGRVVLIGSRAALGKENRVLYGASKAAVTGLGRTLALELAAHQVSVNVIAPGPIATDLFEHGQPVGSPARIKIESSIPLGRVGKPEDIAQTASFLLDDKSGFITGQCVNVCGGLSTGFSAQ